MPTRIVPIVEGHGDVEAVPVLVRRIAASLNVFDVDVKRPVRCPRSKLIRAGELERALELAVNKGAGDCRVLVLIDSDDACPAELALELRGRAAAAGLGVPISVVLAKMEYESWFLGAIEPILGLRPDVGPIVPDPEGIRGAKERFADLLGTPYSEVIDQPSFTASFDMQLSRARCGSFDKCWREIRLLVE